VDIQNLSWCFATVFWAVGPCIVVESNSDAYRVSWSALKPLHSVTSTQENLGFAKINLLRTISPSLVCKAPIRELNHSLAIFVAFFFVLACVLQFAGKD
jgi:hypothetical protein